MCIGMKEIEITINGVAIKGLLEIPKVAMGLVLFVHGAGSSRFSPRNNFVAKELNKAKFATLLLDLLTEEEDAIYENRFDIGLLTERLKEVTLWCRQNPELKNLKIGYFGGSTGSAAALIGAAYDKKISAVVSRGGRPDLAMNVLEKVISPTLLIVGGNDEGVIVLNQTALDKLKCSKKLEVVPGATHLFEEPGTLEKVAELAADWFKKYLI